MYISDIELSMNNLLLNKYNLYKAKSTKIMYRQMPILSTPYLISGKFD